MASFAKFSLAFALAGLAAVTSGSAQTGKTHVVVVSSPQNMTCPITMRAEYGMDGGLKAVKDGALHRGPGQQLQLTLDNSKLTAISAIRITVHGWSGTGRTLPAIKANSSYATASRTLDLALSIGANETADTDVWVSGLTAVDSIDLESVSYSDGSSWKSSDSQACRIMPDPMMLISSR